ncbi:Phthiocerol synthesis polyketide synthase type I PpsC [Symbiodinium microadriaticum]|uniref:Phthiocerol synthesis polyketide synthase type I PpsC n=1 Tax=Symbiodinium microadriaticum TaxID=2951 RepID=A0A1Q9DQK7_SYMMI|nr:Phthiocerol synthesis polyketide synthase type I PpsC [Symbiodinium microadriaticum]CAE7742253.1 ppsC [Symbiodinium microadriaticum]CAE7886070.1 ppsC [Symbiodinium sp. KB8]
MGPSKQMLEWPPEDQDETDRIQLLGQLAFDLTGAIGQDGWCCIHMNDDALVRDAAISEARALSNFASPRAELMPDYFGQDGSGKMATFQDSARNSDAAWALSELDAELTALCKVLAPLSTQALGFTCAGRRKGMVWMPFVDSEESNRLRPQPLTEEDADAGVLDNHLQFIQRRRLCFMRWIANDGGVLELLPRPDQSAYKAMTLPIVQNRLLVFRSDLFSFSYKPTGKDSLALMTWILDTGSQAERQTAKGFFGVDDALQHSEALGIFVGPPMPTGYRMHIMAMHAHVPGGAQDLDGFECMLTSGVDGFIHIPATRFDTEIYCCPEGEKLPGQSYVRHAAMMSDQEITCFDNNFFGIREDEVRLMAPNQRLILEDGYACLRKAGFDRKSLVGRSTAAFLGDTGCDWDPFWQLKVLENPLNPGRPVPWGNCEGNHLTYGGVSKAVSAGRLSHIFGLRGGSTNVDTACSASLVGVSTAVQAMRRAGGGQVKAVADKHNLDALCMGINMLTSPWAFIGLCGPSMLAAKGRCFTFDVSAEGYARGDGFGAVYIKPSDNDEDYLKQLCCLMGAYVNQDGRSATLTAPNGMAQQACIRESMREAMVAASQITIAECHGTGTALGDPIEVGALRGVMEPRDTPLLTTSAKSNIGHTEACAGMIGLIKCVSMVSRSTADPNCHLNSLNPHLDVEGFPSVFETESVETRLNSNYAGVSSFGFSGTNARADVWSQCKSGPRKASSQLDISKADQVHMRCPVTLGLIEARTGEPVTESFKKRRGYKADVLRDEWAPYDISSQVYTGGFRFRRATLQEEGLDLDLESSELYIVGSWSGWTKMERMERKGSGRFVAPVILGEARYEMFRLCIDMDRSMEIYPIIKDASSKIWIEGPDAKSGGRYWLIDGREQEMPSGTLCEVDFHWHPEIKSISWKQVGAAIDDSLTEPFLHSYSLIGSFTSGQFQEMQSVHSGTWEGSFRLGVSGEEDFQIARDGDSNQLIYPAKNGACRTTVPVRGPDSLGHGKFWRIHGMPNEDMKVILEVVEGHVKVTVASEIRGDKTWESEDSWSRHSYFAYASWSGWVPVQMVADPSEPGVFRAYGRMRGTFSPQYNAFVEQFYVVIDEDFNQSLYPELGNAQPFEFIVEGPGYNRSAACWLIRSSKPDSRFEVIVDLTADDRRRRVFWTWFEDARFLES